MFFLWQLNSDFPSSADLGYTTYTDFKDTDVEQCSSVIVEISFFMHSKWHMIETEMPFYIFWRKWTNFAFISQKSETSKKFCSAVRNDSISQNGKTNIFSKYFTF